MKKLSISSALALVLVSALLLVGCKEDGGTASETPNFSVAIEPQKLTAYPGDEFGINVKVIAENGFSDDVTITVNAVPDLSVKAVTSGTKYEKTYNVTVSAGSTIGKKTIAVNVVGGGIARGATAEVTVETNPNGIVSFIASATDTLWGPVGTSVEVTYVAKNSSGATIAKSVLDGLGKTLAFEKSGVRPNSVTVTDVSTSDSYKLKLEFTSLSSDTLTETPVSIDASLDGKTAIVKAVGVFNMTKATIAELKVSDGGSDVNSITVTQTGNNITVECPSLPQRGVISKIRRNRIVSTNIRNYHAVSDSQPTEVVSTWSFGGFQYKLTYK